jgi:hypothetical protein
MSLWIGLLRPERFHGTDADPGPALLVKVTPTPSVRSGRTTIVVPPAGLEAAATMRSESGWRYDSCEPICFEICTHDRESRARQQASWLALGLDDGWAPLLCFQHGADTTRVYHRIESGPAGVLFTAIGERPSPNDSTADIRDALACSRDWFTAARPAFNPGMSHTRWMMGMELERKFTIASQLGGAADLRVDTWALHHALHDELARGVWPGFIPEFNEEFHIWDYESEMFEVLRPEQAQGYVAFIPQADGHTTVKYKRFVVDTELRAESIQGDRPLGGDEFECEARRVSGGEVGRLPGFRRKRFDCDLESLETGNAYGIFFDICRTTDGREGILVQCEVEYLRTRSLAPITAVQQEFERVCELTDGFLRRRGAKFEAGYYSKLSFTRDVARAARAGSLAS